MTPMETKADIPMMFAFKLSIQPSQSAVQAPAAAPVAARAEVAVAAGVSFRHPT